MLKNADKDSLELIDTAIGAETDAGVMKILEQARAAIVLNNDFPLEEKQAAIATLAAKGDQDAMVMLIGARRMPTTR